MSELSERVLFVHAHPDDESISTGGTIATLVDRGASVTVLTCTRGELGEIVDPALTITGPAELALVRERELASALAILGVDDHRWLGSADARWNDEPTRVYLDSGMQWGDSGPEPLDGVSAEALTAAPFAEVASDIAAVIAELMPDAVVSYDGAGGYGHPDHVLASAAARRAAEVMGVPFWQIAAHDAADGAIVVDATSVVDRKRAALLEYRSQLTVGDTWFAGANGEREPIEPVERFLRVRPGTRADTSYAAQSLGARIFTTLVAVLFGGAGGLVTAAAHQSSVLLFVAGIIIGVLIAVGLRIVFSSRIVGTVAAGGFVIVALVLTYGGAGQDVLGGFGVLAELYLVGLVLVVLAGFLRAPKRLLRRG